MAVRLLRAVYAIEFLVALVATLSFWREVGGQYHLDLMPWYIKLVLTVGFAGAIVKLTAVSTGERKRKTLLWAWVALFFLVTGGLVTFYFHLNEPLDEEEDGATLSAVLSPRPIESDTGPPFLPFGPLAEASAS